MYDDITLGSTVLPDGRRMLVVASNVWPLGSLALIFDPRDVTTADDASAPFADTLAR